MPKRNNPRDRGDRRSILLAAAQLIVSGARLVVELVKGPFGH